MVTPLKKFLAKHPTPSGMSSRQWAALSAAMREEKFFSARVENVRLLERLQGMIRDFLTGEREVLENGESVMKVGSCADFVKQAMDWLEAEGLRDADGEGEEYHRDVSHVGAEARLRLIFRTNVRQAVGAAQWESAMMPANLKAWPAFRFVRFPGAKVKRPVHVANEDEVRLKTDFEFWADEMNAAELGGFEVPWPPFGFNSYMDQIPVSRKECEAMGLLKPGEPLKRPRGAERFGIDLVERYGYGKKASTAKLPDELKAKLKKYYEDRWGGKQDGADKVVFPAKQVADMAKKEAEQLEFVFDSPMASVMKKAGLRPRGEATLEQVQSFLQALKTRHPERDWVKEKVGDRISHQFNQAERANIRKNMNEFLSMVDPEVMEKLPKLTQVLKTTGGELGYYDPECKDIAYCGADGHKETHFHEPVHWLHFNCPDAKRKKLNAYFRKRIKGERKRPLRWNNKPGYSDHFAPSFKPEDDYAGKIYGDGLENIYDIYGFEMPTRHLQKLACSPEDFLRYWNDKRCGKYYWRMAFLRCLTLLFK